jgi:hypothetical protein
MDIKTGDEVRVFSRNKYHPGPEDGQVATVTKAGRRWATAAWEVMERYCFGGERSAERTIEFDMETGYEKGANSSYGRYVKTPAQVELDARENAAVASLLARKIRLDRGHGLALEQIEALAEVVKSWEG